MLKPSFRRYFKTDILKNIECRIENSSRLLSIDDLIKECTMYATDMCIEFQKKSEGLLDSDWIDHITMEVSAVFEKLFPDNFKDAQVSIVKIKVIQLMRTPHTALTIVNNYYNR